MDSNKICIILNLVAGAFYFGIDLEKCFSVINSVNIGGEISSKVSI